MSTPKQKAKTFSNQDKLGPLPVPPMKETILKYLHSVRPAVSLEDFEKTKKIVEEFIAPGGEGERLHQKLEERSKTLWSKPNKENWLESWWLQYAYLIWPDPLPVSSNYYIVYHKDIVKAGVPQALQAAKLIAGYKDFKRILDNEELPPEYLRNAPLCMNQFTPIFTTARIPGENGDSLATTKPSDDILVISRRQYYALKTTHPNGEHLSIIELETQLNRILYDSKANPEPRYGIGILTSEKRPTWAKLRNSLLEHENNKRVIDIINKSLFVVVLDENSPQDCEEVARLCFVDNAHNRWYDKMFQCIVFANGRGGEHSPLDAVAIAQVTDHAEGYVKTLEKIDFSKYIRNTKHLPIPEKLQFTIPKDVENALPEAERNWIELSKTVDLKRIFFEGFGTDLVKKAKLSPDSLIQMVIQLSYYKIHKQGCPTYETGHTRQYYHGRTDNVRTFSVDSLHFCKTMVNKDASIEEKWKALNSAIDAHKGYLNDVLNGTGVDRYLLGLRLLATEETKSGKNMPSIFTDKSYAITSSSFKLSTSNLPTIFVSGGFGPAVLDGYGICYQPWGNALNFSICTDTRSTVTSSDRIRIQILQSLAEIESLIKEVTKKQSASKL